MKMFVRRWPALCAFAFAFQFFSIGQVAAQEEDPDVQALLDYRLTDEGLDSFMQASRNLAAVAKADPGLETRMEAPEDASIADLAAMYDSEPAVRKAIASADLTSEEYVTFMYSVMQAGMAAWMVKEHGQEIPYGTPRENVDYYIANEEKIAAMTDEMQEMQEGTGEGEGE